ncbi:hypothetical protein HK101_002567 [Irineochytrium annulatum]|nr:hypothetical protein HK101_002567 [Irineochytrium annulatum]
MGPHGLMDVRAPLKKHGLGRFNWGDAKEVYDDGDLMVEEMEEMEGSSREDDWGFVWGKKEQEGGGMRGRTETGESLGSASSTDSNAGNKIQVMEEGAFKARRASLSTH